MQELIEQIADATGLPPSMVERSAEARAKAEGSSVEAVLAEWAAEEAGAPAAAPEAEVPVEPEPAAGGDEEAAPAPAAAAAAPAAALSAEEALEAVAAARGLPASMVKRSAEARAKAEGSSVEAVLAEWAAEEGVAAAAPAGAVEPEPVAETKKAPPAPDVAAASGDVLEALAAARGLPASMVKRSAEARAKAAGSSVDEVLAEWAEEEGVTAVPAAEAPAAEPAVEEKKAASAPAPAAASGDVLEAVAAARGLPASMVKRSAEARAKAEGSSVDEVLAEWAAEEGVAAAPAAAPAVEAPAAGVEAPPPQPEVEPSTSPEPEAEEDAVEVPTETEPEPAAAIRPSSIPRWLAAAFTLVPLIAVLYLLAVPNGPDCGSSGQLALDPVTGEAIGCEGNPYGVFEINYFTLGGEVYQAQCAACHGSGGGGGSGPAFTDGAVLATFPGGTCPDHRLWVVLGTNGWPDPTYGANDTPTGGVGVMPAFPDLTADEIAAAVLYERVQFGGQDLAAALEDCTADLGEDVTAGG